MLHERVRDQNPQSGDIRTDGYQPDSGEVHLLGKSIPAEDPQTDEGRFQIESQEGFNGKRGAEDVAHEASVFRPVHPKLEFLDDPRNDTDGEVDEENLSPELGHFLIHLIASTDISGFEDGDEDGQSQGQWDEEKVKNGRGGKLPTRN